MQQDILCSRCKTMEASQACKCGGTITTYCESCMEEHLRNKDVSHELINFCYANDLEKEASSIKQDLDRANTDLKNYQSHINFFKESLSSIPDKVNLRLNSLIHDAFHTTDGISGDISYKLAMLENHLAFQRYETAVILERYREFGLRGILNKYFRHFSLMEDDMMVVLNNLIYIGDENHHSIIKAKDQKIGQLEETVVYLNREIEIKDGCIRDLANKLKESAEECERLRKELQKKHETGNRMTQVPSDDSFKL